MPLVSATRGDDLWRWQVGNRGHPFGGIGSIRTRTAHGCVLLARIVGPALYDKCPTGAIPKPGKEAIVSRKGHNEEALSRLVTLPCLAAPWDAKFVTYLIKILSTENMPKHQLWEAGFVRTYH